MRASDLDMKDRLPAAAERQARGDLRHRHPDRQLGHRGVRDAALPAPDLLEAAGISVFDSWAATFGQVVTQVELAPRAATASA